MKSALFSDDWVGFGIALLYESLMKETSIDARAFRDRATAAIWLDVPAEILKLENKPESAIWASFRPRHNDEREVPMMSARLRQII